MKPLMEEIIDIQKKQAEQEKKLSNILEKQQEQEEVLAEILLNNVKEGVEL